MLSLNADVVVSSMRTAFETSVSPYKTARYHKPEDYSQYSHLKIYIHL
jgi:hypothetical protein